MDIGLLIEKSNEYIYEDNDEDDIDEEGSVDTDEVDMSSLMNDGIANATEEIRNELTDQIDKFQQEIKDLQTELGPLQTAGQSYLSKLERGRMEDARQSLEGYYKEV
jgi:thymidylate synthase ThyX